MAEPITPRIELTETPVEARKNYAVWRTDFYICTGIAYAKSMGKTVEDFARFGASMHSYTIAGLGDQGFAPVVQLLHFVIGNYEGGHLELFSVSDELVSMRCNRPYGVYFREGPVLGVTLEEFEAYLWGHVAIMFQGLGFILGHVVKDGILELVLSRKV